MFTIIKGYLEIKKTFIIMVNIKYKFWTACAEEEESMLPTPRARLDVDFSYC